MRAGARSATPRAPEPHAHSTPAPRRTSILTELVVTDYALLLAAGLGAGAINVLAGGGSALTLPVLLALGLDASAANGTNRVGIFAQNLAAVLLFARRGVLPAGPVLRLTVCAAAGAACGAWLAVSLSSVWILRLLGAALLLLAVSLLLQPGRWLQPRPVAPFWMQALALFGCGIYGGLIQAGVGFLLLVALVTCAGLDVVRANAWKVAIVFGYTLVALPFFGAATQIDWRAGGCLAVGHVLGASLGAWLNRPRWKGLVRYVLVAAAVFAALRFLLRAA